MIIFEESLYGWGVCNIPMPRSAFDIFADRRKRNGRLSIFERRRQTELPGIMSSISGFLTNDVPWSQTVTLIFSALLAIIFVFLLSSMVPEFVEEELPEPIEITIELAREPIRKSAPPVMAVSKPLVKERPRTEINPFEIKAKPLPKEPVHEEILPQFKIKPRTKKPLRPQETLIPQVSTLEKTTQTEDVNVSVSVVKKEKYDRANMDRPREKELQLDSSSGFISKRPKDPSVIDIERKTPQKNYKVTNNNKDMVLPASKTALTSTTADVQIVADLSAKQFKKNYTINKKDPSMTVAPENTKALLAQPDVPSARISPATDLKKNYSAEIKDRSKVVLSDTSEPILKQQDVSDATIIPVADMQKNYKVDTEKQAVTIPSAGDNSLLTRQDVVEATFDPLEKSQKNYDIGDLNPNMVKTNDNQSISFDNVEMEDIDPSHLISLRHLAVCADPEEEFHHRTKLATLLREPVKCEANGMLLFFKYPESAYTLRVEIYNPGGIVLKDRCSVLRLAVECVNDQKAKGVIP